jgi:hypothetical protein
MPLIRPPATALVLGASSFGFPWPAKTCSSTALAIFTLEIEAPACIPVNAWSGSILWACTFVS